VAIKSFKCEMLTREYVARFAQEMAFAATLHDQNVVRCRGICVIPPSICIVTEVWGADMVAWRHRSAGGGLAGFHVERESLSGLLPTDEFFCPFLIYL
jgi:hypothetical protein